ncbi:hypothetical protein BWD09_13115 [Neisseria dentiae]|uniref:Uncharacterized protein n=1 Tax=Neisseria dentiae TaxID=194197 RepID=A0A1X3D1R2_9NEIS|nr:hypothetical protein [Neisseria dentiae]OSI13641.1 hypothetical protein BWD09_13115 [Neisseria dentiae]QMT44737.1 hypothetical protein H3L92_09865 [Neisseria dentiae]
MNGFIACRSDEIIPEFKFERENAQTPEDGSVIWVIENGEKRKAAVFDGENKRFFPYNNE